MAHSRSVCVECRLVRLAHLFDHETILVSDKWRPQRKDNDRGWKRVANGDLMWDHRAIARAKRRKREKIEQVRERIRVKKQTLVRK